MNLTLHEYPVDFTACDGVSERARHRMLANSWHVRVTIFWLALVLQSAFATASTAVPMEVLPQVGAIDHMLELGNKTMAMPGPGGWLNSSGDVATLGLRTCPWNSLWAFPWRASCVLVPAGCPVPMRSMPIQLTWIRFEAWTFVTYKTGFGDRCPAHPGVPCWMSCWLTKPMANWWALLKPRPIGAWPAWPCLVISCSSFRKKKCLRPSVLQWNRLGRFVGVKIFDVAFTTCWLRFLTNHTTMTSARTLMWFGITTTWVLPAPQFGVKTLMPRTGRFRSCLMPWPSQFWSPHGGQLFGAARRALSAQRQACGASTALQILWWSWLGACWWCLVVTSLTISWAWIPCWSRIAVASRSKPSSVLWGYIWSPWRSRDLLITRRCLACKSPSQVNGCS